MSLLIINTLEEDDLAVKDAIHIYQRKHLYIPFSILRK